MTVNLFARNPEYDRVLDLVRSEGADVVVFQEVTPAWQRALAPLTEFLPHTRVQPRTDAFGIAVFSRFPLIDPRIRETPQARLPWITTDIRLPGGDVSLLGVHTLPPVGERNSRLRNNQLAELAELVSRTTRPLIVAGDLNCTPWSVYQHGLLGATKLQDARRGFGVLPTWPVHRRGLRIPIDHCLVSAEWRICDCRTGPPVGSDHLPLICDLSLSPRSPVPR